MPSTTRLAIPYPILSDDADVPADLLAALTVVDDAALWDEGSYASRPLTGAVPKGTIYRQTDSGGGYDAGTVTLNTASGWQPLSLTTDQLAAIAGTSGTPSSSNKFLTDADTTVMRTNAARTLTAQHSHQAAPAPLTTTYGSGGPFTIPDTHRPLLYVTATGVTLTLPQAANDGGGPVAIVNASTGDLIVSRAGSDNIDASGTTSITVPARSTVILQPLAGTGYWRTIGVGGEAALDTNRTQTITGAKTFNVAPKHAVQALTATGAISATGGKVVTFVGAASQTLTLPAAVVGMEFTIRNIDATDTVTVARAGSDTIDGATSVVVQPGENLDVRCVAAATWVTEQTVPRNSSRAPVNNVAPVHGVQALTATGSIVAAGGKTVTFAGSPGQTLTLPAAVVGMEFDVVNIDTADAVTVARAGSDTVNGGTSIPVKAGETMRFMCVAAASWVAVLTPRADGVQAFTASGTIAANGARAVSFVGAASQTLTLPPAVVGAEFEIFNIDTSDSVAVARAGSDTIGGAATGIAIVAGGKVTLTCVAAGVWRTTWPFGQQVVGGFTQRTSNLSGAADMTVMTFDGDGLTPIGVEAHGTVANGTATSIMRVEIRDAAAGGGNQLTAGHAFCPSASFVNLAHGMRTPEAIIAGATGSKSIYVRITGTGTPFIAAAAGWRVWTGAG